MVYVKIKSGEPHLPSCFGVAKSGGERLLEQDRKLNPASPPTWDLSLSPTPRHTKGVG